MQSCIDEKRKGNKGFTLVELVIVIAILAILVGLLAPQYTKYVERTRMTADAENLNEMVKAFQVAVADLEGGVPDGVYYLYVSVNETLFYGPKSDADGITSRDDSNYGKLFAEMCETLGSQWLSTCLKSNNWQEAAGASMIHAEITVGLDGDVSVEYYPDQLKQITAKVSGED